MNSIEELEKDIEKFKSNMNDVDNLKEKLSVANSLFRKNLENSEEFEKKMNVNIETVVRVLSTKMSDVSKELVEENKKLESELNILNVKFETIKKLSVSILILNIILMILIFFVLIL